MTSAMPSPALLQAISRLDHAIMHIENVVEDRQQGNSGNTVSDAQIRQAIVELDSLIQSLNEPQNG